MGDIWVDVHTEAKEKHGAEQSRKVAACEQR